MSRQEDIKAPPPGPIQPIFNDSLTQIERERRWLRAKLAPLTSPEEQENVQSAAAAFGAQNGKLPGPSKRAPQPKRTAIRSGPSPTKSAVMNNMPIGAQFLPKTKPTPQPTMSKNLIVPVNAQGAPVPDERPTEPAPKLTFSPAPDNTFCKIAERPRPSNHPLNQPWTQKVLATHNNEVFAIVKDGHIAKLLSDALNVYFHALMQRQAEMEARAKAEAAAVNDADVFDQPLADPTVTEGAPLAEEVDAVTGAPLSAVGEPSEIENLPSL